MQEKRLERNTFTAWGKYGTRIFVKSSSFSIWWNIGFSFCKTVVVASKGSFLYTLSFTLFRLSSFLLTTITSLISLNKSKSSCDI